MKDRIVCGNSNMHDVSVVAAANGVSSRCTEENPCSVCIGYLGRMKLIELIRERDSQSVHNANNKGDSE